MSSGGGEKKEEKQSKTKERRRKKNNGGKGDEIQTLMTSGIGPWLLYGREISFH